MARPYLQSDPQPLGAKRAATLEAWLASRTTSTPRPIFTRAEIVAGHVGSRGDVYRLTADGVWIRRVAGDSRPSYAVAPSSEGKPWGKKYQHKEAA